MANLTNVAPEFLNKIAMIENNQDIKQIDFSLITVDGSGKISARNLYKFLGLRKSDVARWLENNIVNNDFVTELEDWAGFSIVAEGNKIRDYWITINFAKKLCMMSKNLVGEQARQYFLDCEEKLKTTKLPQTYSQALFEAAKLAAQLEAKDLEIANLQENLDHSLDYVSILKVANHNKISENSFSRRLLKAKSIELDYPIKKIQSPRYKSQNLYSILVFKEVYPHYDYNFDKSLKHLN